MGCLELTPDWDVVLAAQRANGAFASRVHLHDGPREDHNGFVTALVLDCLGHAPDTGAIRSARHRAVGFLQSCADPTAPGRFGFYPAGGQPDWMTSALPPDSDDTALVNLALLREGHCNQCDIDAAIATVLLPFQLTYLTERSEPWHRIGAFETWLDETAFRNPVDCTVNVNVLCLLHHSAGDWPQAAAITEMLYAAVDWAGALRARAARLSPWYPAPIEFVYAIDRAAASGVPQMAALAACLHCLDWVREDIGWDLPICGSSDRRIVWTCSALARARANLACDTGYRKYKR